MLKDGMHVSRPSQAGPGGRSEAGARAYEARAPSSVLHGEAAWRIEALRAYRDDEPNPHLRGVDLSRAIPTWVRDVGRALRELHARGWNLREFAYGGPHA